MSNVIDFEKWRRERLATIRPRHFTRRSRRGQGKEANLTTGLVLTEQLLKALRDL